MLYFDKDEPDVRESVHQFQNNARIGGLKLDLSQKAAEVLHLIKMQGWVIEPEEIDVPYYVKPYLNTLYRKGLIRRRPKGDPGFEVSKVGEAVLVICDAAGLLDEVQARKAH